MGAGGAASARRARAGAGGTCAPRGRAAAGGAAPGARCAGSSREGKRPAPVCSTAESGGHPGLPWASRGLPGAVVPAPRAPRAESGDLLAVVQAEGEGRPEQPPGAEGGPRVTPWRWDSGGTRVRSAYARTARQGVRKPQCPGPAPSAPVSPLLGAFRGLCEEALLGLIGPPPPPGRKDEFLWLERWDGKS